MSSCITCHERRRVSDGSHRVTGCVVAANQRDECCSRQGDRRCMALLTGTGCCDCYFCSCDNRCAECYTPYGLTRRSSIVLMACLDGVLIVQARHQERSGVRLKSSSSTAKSCSDLEQWSKNGAFQATKQARQMAVCNAVTTFNIRKRNRPTTAENSLLFAKTVDRRLTAVRGRPVAKSSAKG